jgi:hypothetical protein
MMANAECLSPVFFAVRGGDMISIKNNFGQIKEYDNILIEIVFFIVKVIGLVFLLHLAAGGYPGDAKIKFSELTTASNLTLSGVESDFLLI